MIVGFGAKNRSKDNPQSSGKDHLAQRLMQDLGLTFESSSYFAAKHFIFDKLKDEKGYSDISECFLDRHSEGMRQVWYNLICDFNKSDLTNLSTAIFSEHPIYVGIRSGDELLAAKQKWPDLLCIWVNADKRVEPELTNSCTVTEEMCHISITNNGSLEEYDKKIDKLIELLRCMI